MTSFAEAVFRDHHRTIYRFILGRTHDVRRAEELAQQVFADAVAAVEAARPPESSALAWLYRIARRRLADEARRRARDARLAARLAGVAGRDAPDYGAELTAALRDAAASLPDDQRVVLVRRLVRGEPFAELARSLGVSEGAVKMRYVRALRGVRAYLEDRGIGP